MNQVEFFMQLTSCIRQYDQDNQWFGFLRGGQSWSKGTWIQFIAAAWKLYENARRSPMILLGDTKIRSDPTLLFNFGLAANAKTPQEEKDRLMVEEMVRKRADLASGWRVGGAVELMGPGSILSAKQWSPMLNDSLMLAAISMRRDFLFALNDDEQAVWARDIEGGGARIGAAAFANRAAAFGPTVGGRTPEQQMWLSLIKKVPRILWENGNPRVFVRELLGLKFFGYKPVFTRHQLGFRHQAGGLEANFQNYLDGLKAVGLHNRERMKIMSALGEFLFQDAKALQGIGGP